MSPVTVSQTIKMELCAQDFGSKRLQELTLLFACMNMGVYRGKSCQLRVGATFGKELCKHFHRMMGFRPVVEPKGEAVLLTIPRGEQYEGFIAWIREQGRFNPLRGQTELDPHSLTEAERRAALRATFLGYGSLTDPNKAYHLELGFRRKSLAELTVALLELEGIQARVILRSGGYRIYLKDVRYVSLFLALIGAHSAYLQLEALRVEKEMRNAVNRMVNCDTANLKRVAETSVRQVRDAKLLLEAHRSGVEGLPDLFQVAQLRVDHPELSLRELGMLFDPPLGKSGIHHRLARLHDWATQWRREHEESNLDG